MKEEMGDKEGERSGPPCSLDDSRKWHLPPGSPFVLDQAQKALNRTPFTRRSSCPAIKPAFRHFSSLLGRKTGPLWHRRLLVVDSALPVPLPLCSLGPSALLPVYPPTPIRCCGGPDRSHGPASTFHSLWIVTSLSHTRCLSIIPALFQFFFSFTCS